MFRDLVRRILRRRKDSPPTLMTALADAYFGTVESQSLPPDDVSAVFTFCRYADAYLGRNALVSYVPVAPGEFCKGSPGNLVLQFEAPEGPVLLAPGCPGR